MASDLITAAILGIVEGLTEFIPVSSTGHLILAGHLLKAEGSAASVFDVVIQLGAILAVCWVYRARLLAVAKGVLVGDAPAIRFAMLILVGFLPSAIAGAFLHDTIKAMFSPLIVAASLLIGGCGILLIEYFHRSRPRAGSITAMRWTLALGIGLCQLLSLVPGVSRSGATIMGGIALGADRKTATEFSFFLAIPTMFGASVFDLIENRTRLQASDLYPIAVGLLVSFAVGIVVIKWLVRFVSHHDFRIFGWYRIVVGGTALIILSWTGVR